MGVPVGVSEDVSSTEKRNMPLLLGRFVMLIHLCDVFSGVFYLSSHKLMNVKIIKFQRNCSL